MTDDVNLAAQIIRAHRRNRAWRPEVHNEELYHRCMEGCAVLVDPTGSIDAQFAQHQARWIQYGGLARTGNRDADVQHAGQIIGRHDWNQRTPSHSTDRSWGYTCLAGCVLIQAPDRRLTVPALFAQHQATELTLEGFSTALRVAVA